MESDEPQKAPEGAGPAEGAPASVPEAAAEDWGTELPAGRPDPEVPVYGALLGLITVTFAVEGVASGSDLTRVVLTAVIGAIMVLALHVARARPWVMQAGVLVAIVLVLVVIAEALTGSVDDGTTRLADAVLVAIAPPAIFIGVIRRLRKTRAVTIESVLGVLCVYILLGMFFAFVFGAIDQLGNGPFFEQEVTATASRCQYYSFTTLATVGYGDLTARTNLGHTLSVSEALLGQVYLVTVVSLIVGNLGRRRRSPA
jgi:hypothetical protein